MRARREGRRAGGIAAAILVACVSGCTPGVPPTQASGSRPAIRGIEEPSGVIRDDDALLIVGDGDPGVYYRLPLRPGEGAGGGLIPLEPARLTRHPVAPGGRAGDLESIARLADGRIVVLSEDEQALLDADGIVAVYEDAWREIRGRGCEGLAVRELPGGVSRVAMLWEGGYPDSRGLPAGQGPAAMAARVTIHDLAPGQTGAHVRPGGPGVTIVELETPRPPGREPRAQRFRGPDLVWHRLVPGDDASWGFIVLLSSAWAREPEPGSPEECPPAEDGTPRRYCYKWLQRFSLDGRPFGDPFDLEPVFPAALRSSNWEGLAWFVPGESLVLVYDESIAERVVDPQQALVLPLPEGW